MPAKIKDDEGKQQYMNSFPQVWPCGSEFSVYSSDENRRMLIKHASGSHIEFKDDGSVIIKANKQLLVNCSVEDENLGDGTNQNAEMSVIKCESDMQLNVEGALKINCKTFELMARDSGKVNTSGDFIYNGNNTILRAKEQVSIEPAKSMYVSTGELRENITTRTTEAGSSQSGIHKSPGGHNKTTVMGHHIIENNDPKGGITIRSAGYLNIVSAAERIDVTGMPAATSNMFDPTPMGRATYTHIVGPGPGPTPRGIPGSSYFEVGPGGLTEKITGPVVRDNLGPTTKHTFIGPFDEKYSAIKKKEVGGAEKAEIAGIYKVTAQTIFLN